MKKLNVGKKLLLTNWKNYRLIKMPELKRYATIVIIQREDGYVNCIEVPGMQKRK